MEQFLPEDSTAASMHACRYFYFTFGTKHLEVLVKQPNSRIFFLTLLEKDLHDFILCYTCKKLHSVLNFYTYDGCCDQKYTSLQIMYRNIQFLGENFNSVIYQMVMKLYSQDRDYSELLKSLSSDTKEYRTQHITQTKVVAGSMLLRFQQITIIPDSQALAVPIDFSITICPHMSYTSMKRKANMARFVWFPMEHSKNPEYWNRLVQCQYCTTEFKVTFRTLRGQGKAIIVTIWKDIGEARTPVDPKLERQTQDSVDALVNDPIHFEPGSICKGFEGVDHTLFNVDGPELSKTLDSLRLSSPLKCSVEYGLLQMPPTDDASPW
jgi:hypothetical protein